jgi:hypothetical protein
MIDDVARYLAGFALRFGTEIQLQDDVATALEASIWKVGREWAITANDRIDFYLPEVKLGIECKIDGSRSFVSRQLIRYASKASVSGLILVSRRRGHALSRDELVGKPFRFVWCGDNQL